jgi:phage protein D
VAEQNTNAAVAFKVKLGGSEVDSNDLASWEVSQDLGQPHMAVVTVRDEAGTFSESKNLGDPIEVTAGEDDEELFKGEVVGIESVYRANGENTTRFRAFNKLHRLGRGRKSRTFVSQSDKDIVGTVAGDHGLSPQCGSDPSITHDHVYQHNQTDLEFLRVRAARLGYDVWVEDTKLYFDKPDPGKDSGIKLRYGDAETSSSSGEVFLKRFMPRLSATAVVSKVTVRGWNPEKKEEIVGEVEASASKLGKTGADSASNSAFGEAVTFEVDFPIFSVDEAKAIAQAKLDTLLMSYITGDGECRGTPGMKPGVVVTCTVNPDESGARFNGKYMLVGCTHRFTNAKSGDSGGYVTAFRFNRDAEGQ